MPLLTDFSITVSNATNTASSTSAEQPVAVLSEDNAGLYCVPAEIVDSLSDLLEEMQGDGERRERPSAGYRILEE